MMGGGRSGFEWEEESREEGKGNGGGEWGGNGGFTYDYMVV